jgi:predicted ester cyclase
MNIFAREKTPETVERRNKETIRRQIEKWTNWNSEEIAADFAEDARNHGEPVGRDGIRIVIEDIWRTFPDFRGEILEIVAEAETVVARVRVSGTHLGTGEIPVNGVMLVGVAPTGKSFTVEHIHVYKMRDGEIVDHYAARDDLGMMRQLGLLPRRAGNVNSTSDKLFDLTDKTFTEEHFPFLKKEKE